MQLDGLVALQWLPLQGSRGRVQLWRNAACVVVHKKMCAGWQESLALGGNRIGAKFALLQSEEAAEQKGTKFKRELKKNVHKYMLCIYLYIYRCNHGGVGANRGSFCAFVAGGKGAAREEIKEERKKEKQKQCIFFGLVMSMETVQAQQMRSVPTEVVCV